MTLKDMEKDVVNDLIEKSYQKMNLTHPTMIFFNFCFGLMSVFRILIKNWI